VQLKEVPVFSHIAPRVLRACPRLGPARAPELPRSLGTEGCLLQDCPSPGAPGHRWCRAEVGALRVTPRKGLCSKTCCCAPCTSPKASHSTSRFSGDCGQHKPERAGAETLWWVTTTSRPRRQSLSPVCGLSPSHISKK